MVFSAVFNIISLTLDCQCIYSCLPGIPFISAANNILSKALLLCHKTIVRTMDRGERGMNPVTLTVIYPWKENWPGQRLNKGPPVL